MRAYFCVTANLQAFGYKRFHFTIELKISISVRFGPDLLISFGSTVQNWNCDNPSLIAPPAYSRQPQVVMNISNVTQSITIFVDSLPHF